MKLRVDISSMIAEAALITAKIFCVSLLCLGVLDTLKESWRLRLSAAGQKAFAAVKLVSQKHFLKPKLKVFHSPH